MHLPVLSATQGLVDLAAIAIAISAVMARTKGGVHCCARRSDPRGKRDEHLVLVTGRCACQPKTEFTPRCASWAQGRGERQSSATNRDSRWFARARRATLRHTRS